MLEDVTCWHEHKLHNVESAAAWECATWAERESGGKRRAMMTLSPETEIGCNSWDVDRLGDFKGEFIEVDRDADADDGSDPWDEDNGSDEDDATWAGFGIATISRWLDQETKNTRTINCLADQCVQQYL